MSEPVKYVHNFKRPTTKTPSDFGPRCFGGGALKIVNAPLNTQVLKYKKCRKSREIDPVLVLLYKCLYNQGAPYISEFFNFKNVPYNLRGLSTRLELPYFNMEWMHRSFAFLACKLWNALPPTIRESKDIKSFIS